MHGEVARHTALSKYLWKCGKSEKVYGTRHTSPSVRHKLTCRHAERELTVFASPQPALQRICAKRGVCARFLAILGLLDLVEDVGFARIGRAGGGLRRGGRQHAGRVAGRRRERAERRARLEQDVVQGGRAGRRVVGVHVVELAEEVVRVARGLERDEARPRGRLV